MTSRQGPPVDDEHSYMTPLLIIFQRAGFSYYYAGGESRGVKVLPFPSVYPSPSGWATLRGSTLHNLSLATGIRPPPASSDAGKASQGNSAVELQTAIPPSGTQGLPLSAGQV